jgi:ankyrin repeat protein
MTTRMTAPRLARLVAAGDVAAVRTAVADAPRLLAGTVEHAGETGWTPLHLAAAAGREDVVRVLVGAGADLTARTESGRTPLHVAVEHAPGLVEVLAELGAVPDAPAAASLDDAGRLARELDAGAPLTDPASGLDLLTLAAATLRRADLVRVLLAAGASVDRRDPDTGRTPLHEAVSAGAGGDAPEVVRVLLAAGADVNATTSDGASALDISRVAAARSRRDDAGRARAVDGLVDLLVASGATD